MRRILIFLVMLAPMWAITVDGTRDGSGYSLLGSTPSTYRDGFGGSGQLGNGTSSTGTLYFGQDATYIYIFVVSKLPTDATNALGLWVNFSHQTGTSAGSVLGNDPGGNYIDGDGGSNIDYKADFEVDYQFAFNSGGGSTNVYCDSRKQVATATNSYLGSSNQTGGTETGQGTDYFADDDFTYAFNNSGGTANGCEIRIKKSAVGSPTGSDNMQLFAFIVSATGYFSNTCAPGDAGASNLGNNPDYSSISSQDFFTVSGDASLPVELSAFSAHSSSKGVKLTWTTDSEIENHGFTILRKGEAQDWKEVASFTKYPELEGQGSTTEATDYHFIDTQVKDGWSYSYQLADVDYQGKKTYHKDHIQSITYANPGKDTKPGALKVVKLYPNPFNPAVSLTYDLTEMNDLSVSIYNLAGEQVWNHAKGNHPAGQDYTLSWNGNDMANTPLPSGIYLVNIQAGTQIKSEKVTLLR